MAMARKGGGSEERRAKMGMDRSVSLRESEGGGFLEVSWRMSNFETECTCLFST